MFQKLREYSKNDETRSKDYRSQLDVGSLKKSGTI